MQVLSRKKLIWIVLLILLVGFLSMRVVQNNTTPKLGVEAGQLKPLSSKPNAVSSQAKDETKRVTALSYELSTEEQLNKVARVIESMPGAKIVQQEPNYIHAIFTTKLMRFKDDVEVYLDDDAKLMHFRSASRVGYSDLGVNRKRYERFVELLN